MRIARKLLVFAAICMAAMAMVVSTAVAQGPGGVTVEIRNETTGSHIPGNSIWVHATGEAGFFGHVFGIEAQASDCLLEFEGNVNEDGEGAVTSATFSDHGGQDDCTREPCPGTNPITPWPMHFDRVNGQLRVWIEFCIIPDYGGPENRFESSSNITSGPAGDHDYEFPYADSPGVVHAGPRGEMTGSIHFETEFFHLPFEIM